MSHAVEIIAAAERYDGHARGLGERFMSAVDEVVGRIAQAPSTFPVWDHDERFRRAVVRRFPYLVFYREMSHAVEIIAVAHGARAPGYWLTR